MCAIAMVKSLSGTKRQETSLSRRIGLKGSDQFHQHDSKTKVQYNFSFSYLFYYCSSAVFSSTECRKKGKKNRKWKKMEDTQKHQIVLCSLGLCVWLKPFSLLKCSQTEVIL